MRFHQLEIAVPPASSAVPPARALEFHQLEMRFHQLEIAVPPAKHAVPPARNSIPKASDCSPAFAAIGSYELNLPGCETTIITITTTTTSTTTIPFLMRIQIVKTWSIDPLNLRIVHLEVSEKLPQG